MIHIQQATMERGSGEHESDSGRERAGERERRGEGKREIESGERSCEREEVVELTVMREWGGADGRVDG